MPVTAARHVSTFDLFTIGVGPSSSHTVGPMKAAADFVDRLAGAGDLERVAELEVHLYGSLAATGHGHGTPDAVLLGLEGCRSDRIEPAEMTERLARIAATGALLLGGGRPVPFSTQQIVQHPLTFLDRHSNGMRFAARDAGGGQLAAETYFSIGGGAIEREGDELATVADADIPFPFATAAELLAHCEREQLSFSGVMLANELASTSFDEVAERLAAVHAAMESCAASGMRRTGALPGGLAVPRRAPVWHERLERENPQISAPYWQEWLGLVAMAVNEENASGGRVVTAPTNGAAGIIPAVLFYATHFLPGSAQASVAERAATVREFLLTAAAVGVLYKAQASISGAEVGCQGEVGSASSMAAAGLAHVLGGTPRQVENAAEIAMEHNLGLTCDPIGGLVQIPCIERNAMGASKAVHAARMALWGDGTHVVSLDQVIVTMRETGRDMSAKYKETSTGGLAVNVVEC